MATRLIVKFVLMYLSGPLIFGALWFTSPPTSFEHGIARGVTILTSQILSTFLTSRIRDRFGRKYALLVIPLVTIGSIHIVILSFGWVGIMEIPRDLLLQVSIAFALLYGICIGGAKYGERKTSEAIYRFVSTGSVVAVLAFGTLRVLEEIAVRGASDKDNGLYIMAMPIMLIALWELTRRELDRPD